MKRLTKFFIIIFLVIQAYHPVLSVHAKKSGELTEDILSTDTLTNPYYYNVVVSNNHTSNQADIEGGIAVGGTSYYLGESWNGFTYGGYFDNYLQGLGDHYLLKDQKVALMIKNQVQNSNPVIGGANITIGQNGYFIMSDDLYDNWLNSAYSDYTIAHDGKDYYHTDINSVFDTLANNIAYIESEYDKHIDSATAFTGTTGLTVAEIGQCSNSYSVSTLDGEVLIITVSTNSDNESYMPYIRGDITRYKKIIVTSAAETIGFIDYNHGIKGTVSNEILTDIAHTVDYYLPNAKVIMNYAKNDLASSGSSAPGLYTYSDIILDNPGESLSDDIFKSSYFTNSVGYKANTLEVGSIIATNASIIWSGGSINGNIFAKNFHQRDGSEAHNYVSNSVVDFSNRRSAPEEPEVIKPETPVTPVNPEVPVVTEPETPVTPENPEVPVVTEPKDKKDIGSEVDDGEDDNSNDSATTSNPSTPKTGDTLSVASALALTSISLYGMFLVLSKKNKLNK